MPTSFLNDWTSVIHLTVDGDRTSYGDRTPGVWFQPDNYMYFSSALNGLIDGASISTVRTQLMEWTKVKISQQLIDEKYIFTVYVAETEVYAIENTLPKEFNNIKVYLSDPWYISQPGLIRNFVIVNTCAGKYLNT